MKFGHGHSNQAIFDMMTLGQQPGHASGSLLVSGSIIAKEGDISGSAQSTGSFGRVDLLSNGSLRINQGGRGDEGTSNNNGITLFQSTTFTGNLTTTANLFSRIFDDNKLVLANHFNNAGGGISLRTMAGGSQTTAIDIAGNTGITTIKKGLVVQDSATINTDLIVTGSVSGSLASTGSFGRVVVPAQPSGGPITLGGGAFQDVIIGDGSGSGDIVLDGNSESVVRFKTGGAEKWFLRATSGNFIEFRRNSQNYFRIDGSGNVGINLNNDSPSERLHVKGNIFATGNISGSATSTGSFGRLKVDSRAIIGEAYIGQWEAAANYAIFANSELDQTAAGNYSILAQNNGKTLINAATSREISFRINNSEKAVIDSSGNFIIDGNISGSSTSTGSFGHVMQDGKGLPPQFTTGSSIFIGENAGASDDGSDNRNIGIGKNALDAATTGHLNIAIGDDALTDVTTGNHNVAIGFESQKDTTGGNNTSVGYNSLEYNTSGNNNVAIGYAAAGGFTYSGADNIAIGFSALGGNSVSGDFNIAIGKQALNSNTTADDNLAIGDFALSSAGTDANSSRNLAIGSEALRHVVYTAGSSGFNNTALGWNAGKRFGDNAGNLTSASYGVYIGHTTYPLENNSFNEILIGSQVRGKGSNTATIGDGNITDIYLSQDQGATVHTGNVSGSSTSTGSFGKLEVGSQIRLIEGGDSFIKGGDLGIGTTTPVARLEIEDDNTTNAMLLKLTQDNNSVYGMVIGNDTFSTTDTEGGQHILGNDGTYIIRSLGTSTAARIGAGLNFNNYKYLEIDFDTDTAEFTTTNISGSATSTGSFGLVLQNGSELSTFLGDRGTETLFSGSVVSTGSFGRLDIVDNVSATSFTGIFQGALSGSAQIASNISGAFAVASASFAANILSNSSSFAARDTLSEATSSKILNGKLEFTNITGSGHVSMSLSSTGSFGRVSATTIGGHSPLIVDSNTTFINSITSSAHVSSSMTSTASFGRVNVVALGGHQSLTIDPITTFTNVITASNKVQFDDKIFIETGSIEGDLHIRTNENLMRFGKSTNQLVVSASISASRFATGSDGSIIDLGFTAVDEEGNVVLTGEGDGIHVDSNNYWYNNKFYRVGNGRNDFLVYDDKTIKYSGEVVAQTGSFAGEMYINSPTGSMFIGKFTGGIPNSGSDNTSRFATGSDGSIIDLGFTTTDEDGNVILTTTGDGLHVDEDNYWYTSGHFKLGDGSKKIEWNTNNLNISASTVDVTTLKANDVNFSALPTSDPLTTGSLWISGSSSSGSYKSGFVMISGIHG